VNAVYSTFFRTSPPARACVAVDLPHPIRVRLDCVAFVENDHRDRQALHVQGLSYWAPANIGPYSQAITVCRDAYIFDIYSASSKVGERIFISGQIGLIPSRLALPSPPSLAMETALASQHVARVTEALRTNSGGGWVGHTQAAIYWLADTNNLIHVKRALHISAGRLDVESPTLFLVTKELPKDAMVEKQVLLHTGRCEIVDEDDGDVSLQTREPLYQQSITLVLVLLPLSLTFIYVDTVNFASGAALHWEVSRFDDTRSSFAMICVRGGWYFACT
jgi:diphthine-ammonia ligase